jgi:hypothetical protein
MVMERVPSDLAEAEVLTPEGASVRIAETWEDRPVVLAFVRHFG